MDGVRIVPVEGLPEISPGDDLGATIAAALEPLGVATGDVVAVTQKIVSKAEGRLVRAEGGDRASWVERESRRVVARRGDLVVAETRHGFVCANAGVDASNVAEGWLALLPEDPDASAAGIRDAVRERVGVDAGVVVTDTFGRPWRQGLVDVAIGCAGIPALVDLRGTHDHHGRELEATVFALADAVAGASGLVMTKAARVPVALVRGLVVDADAPDAPARSLVRPPRDDLFRESPGWMLASAAEAGSLSPAEVPREAIEEAVAAAARVASELTFVAAISTAARRRIAAAVGGVEPAEDATIASASALIVPVANEGADRFAAGAAIERLGLALHARGLGWAWARGALARGEEVRAAIGAIGEPLGVVAVGGQGAGAASRRPPPDLSVLLRFE